VGGTSSSPPYSDICCGDVRYITKQLVRAVKLRETWDSYFLVFMHLHPTPEGVGEGGVTLQQERWKLVQWIVENACGGPPHGTAGIPNGDCTVGIERGGGSRLSRPVSDIPAGVWVGWCLWRASPWRSKPSQSMAVLG